MDKVLERKPLSAWLADWRKANRLTLREVAEEFGVTVQAVSHWELGDNLPRGIQLQRMLAKLRITIAQIDFGTEA